MTSHRLLHAERRVAAAEGVVFLRQGGAEERHDAVPHHLIHRALVPVNGFHHQLEDRVQDSSSLLGIPFGHQLH